MSTVVTKIACCLFRFASVVAYVLFGAGIFVLVEPDDGKYESDADRYFEYTNLAFMSITTIGDSKLFPKADAGKIAYIVYSFFGIPLVLWALAITGELQTRFYSKVCCEERAGEWAGDRSDLDNRCARCRCMPFFFSSFVFLSIGALSGFVTSIFTKASFVEASYFWLTVWTTVGHGNLNLSHIGALVFWKWFGLVLISGVIHSYLRWMDDMGKTCEFYCCKCYSSSKTDAVESQVAKSMDLHYEPVLV